MSSTESQLKQQLPVQPKAVYINPTPKELRQWTDDSGYTWRAMDDGTTYWWTGSDWKKYG